MAIASSLILTVLPLTAWSGVSLQPEEPANLPSEPIVAAVVEPPVLPEIRLARIQEFADDDAFVADVERRVADVLPPASPSDVSPARVDRQLAAANLLLAERLEPLCSRRILALPDPENFSAQPWLDTLNRAETLLEESQTLMAQLGQNGELPEGWLTAAQRHRETLTAFASGLRAYLFPAGGDEGRRERQLGASALSPLLEHPEAAVREAATLWQAQLRLALGDVDRAATLLPSALADPEAERMPYAFYVRLLRCRLAAQRGWPTAALAALMQLGQRCDNWFPEQVLRERAARTALIEQLRVLRGWFDALDPQQQADQRAWCAAQMQSLIDAYLEGPSVTALRLGRAVPIVVVPPAAAPPSNVEDKPKTDDGE